MFKHPVLTLLVTFQEMISSCRIKKYTVKTKNRELGNIINLKKHLDGLENIFTLESILKPAVHCMISGLMLLLQAKLHHKV